MHKPLHITSPRHKLKHWFITMLIYTQSHNNTEAAQRAATAFQSTHQTLPSGPVFTSQDHFDADSLEDIPMTSQQRSKSQPQPLIKWFLVTTRLTPDSIAAQWHKAHVMSYVRAHWKLPSFASTPGMTSYGFPD
jgi:hypothetical protein